MDLSADTDKGGYVAPRVDCPHSREIPDLPVINAYTSLSSPCQDCNTQTENWLCLTCHTVYCSRYVKAHMSAHNTSTHHPLAISLSDLNTWCYECDAYVISRKLDTVHKTLHLMKFGSIPGENLGVEVRGGKREVLGAEEKEEGEESVRSKVKILAEWVKASNCCTIFTGAGISTSAKIPDFRGPEGVWTLKAKGLQADSIKLESAIPTPCHMSIVALQNYFSSNNKKCIIVSQNIDGLHRRSGIPKSGLAELHGNSFVEVCWKCDKDYLRTFDTAVHSGLGGKNCAECKARVPQFCHCTSRKCECGGVLKDSIIHFGENLPKRDLSLATEHSLKSDLCIVLGSSLTVSPANHIPDYTKENGGKVCIVNLQSTAKDGMADLRIFAKTDLLSKLLMEELGLEIKEFDISHFFM